MPEKPIYGTLPTKNGTNAENTAPLYIVEAYPK